MAENTLKNWFEEVELTKYIQREPLRINVGQITVRVIEEPKFIDMASHTKPNETVKKAIIPVLQDGVAQDSNGKDKEFAWFVTVAKSEDSLFGQIARIAKQRKGLKNAALRVTAAGQGIKRSYTVELLTAPTP